MNNDILLPHSRQILEWPELGLTMTIEPAVGYFETNPVTGFLRTYLREAPTRVAMARALMGHALAVLDEIESLTEREFVDVCDAYVPLVKKVTALPERVAWSRPGGLAVHKPEG